MSRKNRSPEEQAQRAKIRELPQKNNISEIRPKLQKWGYQLPHSLVINARAEIATGKPSFRDSVVSESPPPAFLSGTRKCGCG